MNQFTSKTKRGKRSAAKKQKKERKNMSIAAAFGNVAQDPHIKKNEDGEVTYAKFTLVEDKYTNRGRTTVYIDWVAFGRMAKVVDQLLEKGSEVYLEGTFVSGEYKASDGKTVYTRNVRVDRLILPTSRRASNKKTESTAAEEPKEERALEPLPFSNDDDEIEYEYFED